MSIELIRSVERNSFSNTGFYLQNSNPNTCNQDGKSVLDIAVDNGNLPIAMLLVNRGATITESAKTFFNNQLCKHIWENNTAEAIRILDTYYDPHHIDLFGWSALHLAATKKNTILLKILLKHGANSQKKSTNDESKSAQEIWESNGVEIDIAEHSGSDEHKNTLYIYEGPDKEHHQKHASAHTMHYLFNHDLLSKYFNVTIFYKFSELIEKITQEKDSKDELSVILDLHGENAPEHTLLIDEADGMEQKPAYSVYQKVASASPNRPLKLLSTACFGANVTDYEAAVSRTSKFTLITLSGVDSVFHVSDAVHHDVLPMCETVSTYGPMDLDHVVQIYAMSQRYTYNVPKIRIYNPLGEGLDFIDIQIIDLTERSTSALKDKTERQISPLVMDLFHLKGLDAKKLYDGLRTQWAELPISDSKKFAELFRAKIDIDKWRTSTPSSDSFRDLYSKFYPEGQLSDCTLNPHLARPLNGWSMASSNAKWYSNYTPIMLLGQSAQMLEYSSFSVFSRGSWHDSENPDSFAMSFHSAMLGAAAGFHHEDIIIGGA